MGLQTTIAADSVVCIRESLERHARYSLGKPWRRLSARERFTAVALSVRDRLVDRMLETDERCQQDDPKRLYYLSIEFLIGRLLSNNLQNLGIYEPYRRGLSELGVDLQELEQSEEDAALGNGGLGRLAACFLDSLATLGLPGYGYGINYEYGLFRQEIDNGYQREKPDNWLAQSTSWEIARPEESCIVPLYGHIEHAVDRRGGYNPMWLGWRVLVGVPYDIPIAGYGGATVNYLRLYSARSSRDFDMQIDSVVRPVAVRHGACRRRSREPCHMGATSSGRESTASQRMSPQPGRPEAASQPKHPGEAQQQDQNDTRESESFSHPLRLYGDSDAARMGLMPFGSSFTRPG